MLRFNKILVRLGLLEITSEKVSIWATERDISKLILALEMGNYKIRKFAATALGNLKTSSALKVLAVASKDEVKAVAIAAMASLKKFLPSTEVEKYLADAELFWTEKNRVETGRRNYHKVRKVYFGREARMWNKDQMQKLSATKAFLKKGHRGANFSI